MNWNYPICDFYRTGLCATKRGSLLAIALPMAMVGLLLVALPFSSTLQTTMMRRFHLRSDSFGQWATLQLAPSMYNFANEVWITDISTNEELLRTYPQYSQKVWSNHFPMDWIAFRDRQALVENVPNFEQYCYLSSTFGATHVFSKYKVTAEESGSIRLAPESKSP